MRYALPLLFSLAAMTGAAQAEPLEALTEDGRYQLMEINDKIVRLDTRSGRFELCRMENDDWKCLVAQDERERLEDTVAALSKRIATLEAAQRNADATRQAATAPVMPPRTPSPSSSAVPAPTTVPAPVPTTVPTPVIVAAPKVADAAPAPSGSSSATPQAWSGATASAVEGPVPAEPVPSDWMSAADPTKEPATSTGRPFDISPGATERKPGLFERITGLLPGIGW